VGATFLPRCPAAPLPRCPAALLPRLLLFPTDAPIPQSLPARLKITNCTRVDSIQPAPLPEPKIAARSALRSRNKWPHNFSTPGISKGMPLAPSSHRNNQCPAYRIAVSQSSKPERTVGTASGD
jgi:hypothetical protein